MATAAFMCMTRPITEPQDQCEMDKIVGKRMYPDHQQRREEQRNGVRKSITRISNASH